MGIKIKMGAHSYGAIKAIGKTDAKVTVGKFCSIGSGVQAILVGHEPGFVSTYPFKALWKGEIVEGRQEELPCNVTTGDVTIGNDVWIGNNVTFLAGAEVDNGCIIGANSVVRGYISPYAIVIGNPAKEIRYRFSHYIDQLQYIKWWDWPDEKINKCLHLLCQKNIKKFIKNYKKYI